TNLSELKATWKVVADGQTLQSGTLALDVAPRAEAEVQIPVKQPRLTAGAEYWLMLEFTLPEDTPWAGAGHEVGFAQLRLPWKAAASTQPRMDAVDVRETDNTITTRGALFRYDFDKEAGTFTSLQYRGAEILAEGPKLNVWRAPIPNETSGWGQAEAGWWIAARLDRASHTVDFIEVSQRTTNSARIHLHTVTAHGNPAQSVWNCYVYKVLGSGDILVSHEARPEVDRMPWLPKLGLQMKVPTELQNVRWYGRGPVETYPDRKTGAKIGIYQKKVPDLHVPYLVGQDQGNMADVRWLALTNDAGAGLAVFGMPTTNVSVHEYSNLDRTVYPFQLKKGDALTLNIDHRVTGLGGTPVTARPEHRTHPDFYDYQIRLRPLAAGDDPLALSKQLVQ
ncbi:MAG: DUF4981 domain-containing protein, partial [bacterium]|nr:DUF4981 domain-containing protein [bacterium]